MRVCVIGDSSLAAMKQGWPQIAAQFPEVELTFFAAPQDRLKDLCVANGKLTSSNKHLARMLAKTSGGMEAIAGDYDAYLVCGLRLRPTTQIFREYLIAAKQGQADKDATTTKTYDAFQSILMTKVLADLRKITKAPIVVIGMPFAPDGHDYPLFTKLKSAGADEDAIEMFNSAAHATAAAHRAEFLPQPDTTIGETKLTTRRELNVSPVKLHEGNVQQDSLHMNAEYGAIVMANALNVLIARSK